MTKASTHEASTARWSQRVTETSDAMDLKPEVFTGSDPAAIARSLKASAEHSRRRKSEPYRSAMSMLTFYINRAGAQLAPTQRRVLERAKDELRILFGRAPRPASSKKNASATSGRSRSPRRAHA